MKKRLFGNPIKRKAILRGKKRRRAVRHYILDGFSLRTAKMLVHLNERMEVVRRAFVRITNFITSGVWHHVKYNRHHPEYHLDHDDMTQVDLIEMVSDWYAMSEEYNSNIDDWVTYVAPRRYHFSADKVDTIHQLIEILRQYKLKDQKGG